MRISIAAGSLRIDSSVAACAAESSSSAHSALDRYSTSKGGSWAAAGLAAMAREMNITRKVVPVLVMTIPS